MTDETQAPEQEAPKPSRQCSFCDKSQGEVKKIIASQRDACICDECAELCVDICREDSPPPTRAHQQFCIERSIVDQLVVLCAAESTLAVLSYEGEGADITIRDIVQRVADHVMIRPRLIEELKEQIAVGSADSDAARVLLEQLEREVELSLPPAQVSPSE